MDCDLVYVREWYRWIGAIKANMVGTCFAMVRPLEIFLEPSEVKKSVKIALFDRFEGLVLSASNLKTTHFLVTDVHDTICIQLQEVAKQSYYSPT